MQREEGFLRQQPTSLDRVGGGTQLGSTQREKQTGNLINQRRGGQNSAVGHTYQHRGRSGADVTRGPKKLNIITG